MPHTRIPKFGGVIVPMGTPFTHDGKIDVPSARRIVQHLTTGGVHGIFILGTMGEGLSIPVAERLVLVEAVAAAIRETGKPTPFYINISANCLADTIDLAKRFTDLAGDQLTALVAHTPFYFPITDAMVEAYFDKLLAAVPAPTMLYNIPQTTKVTIPIPALLNLLKHPRAIGLKDSDPSPQRYVDVLAALKDTDVPVVVGNGLLATHGMKHGAAGVIVSAGNLIPDQWVAWFDLAIKARSGQIHWSEVEALQAHLDVTTASYMKGRPLGASIARMKALMAKQGLCTNAVLPPLLPETL
jgi:4-hydroxy-tetrahydrodipicolinate synthase